MPRAQGRVLRSKRIRREQGLAIFYHRHRAGTVRWFEIAAWESLDGPWSSGAKDYVAVVARNQDGRLEVFGVAGDWNIWHLWQTTPNGGWIAAQPM